MAAATGVACGCGGTHEHQQLACIEPCAGAQAATRARIGLDRLVRGHAIREVNQNHPHMQ